MLFSLSCRWSMGKVLQARSTMHAKSKLMPSSSLCQVQNDVKCNDSTLYCKLLSCGVSRRCRTRRRWRRSRGVTPTGSLSRLCQTPSGLSHIVLRQYASTRAAAMIVSHVSMCPHLTHSCDTIHIPAALSLPPYQRWKKISILCHCGYVVFKNGPDFLWVPMHAIRL